MIRIQAERTPGAAGMKKRANNASETSVDFRAILREKPKEADDAPVTDAKQNDAPERETPQENGEPKNPEASDELLAMLGLGQMLVNIQPPQEEAEAPAQETPADGLQTDTEALTLTGLTKGANVPAEASAAQTAEPQTEVPDGDKTSAGEILSVNAETTGADRTPSGNEGLFEEIRTAQTPEAPKEKTRTAAETAPKHDDRTETEPQAEAVHPQVQPQTDTHTTPVKRTEQPQVVTVRQPEELPKELAKLIETKLVEQGKEFEVVVNPANLGKIAVHILYEAGQTTISLLCSEKKTTELLAQHARTLGDIVEQNLGETTTVVVDRQQPGENYQDKEGFDQAGREAEQERQREEREKQQHRSDSSHFLQKLRLGLTD